MKDDEYKNLAEIHLHYGNNTNKTNSTTNTNYSNNTNTNDISNINGSKDITISLFEALLPNITYFNITKVDIITLANSEYMGILQICLSLVNMIFVTSLFMIHCYFVYYNSTTYVFSKMFYMVRYWGNPFTKSSNIKNLKYIFCTKFKAKVIFTNTYCLQDEKIPYKVVSEYMIIKKL